MYLAEKLTDPSVSKVDKYFEESDLEAELVQSKTSILSTMNEVLAQMCRCQAPATLRYQFGANACTDEIQNYRQIAATDTVILIDDQINETSASSKKPAARDVSHIDSQGRP